MITELWTFCPPSLYVSRGCNLITVLLSIPFNKLLLKQVADRVLTIQLVSGTKEQIFYGQTLEFLETGVPPTGVAGVFSLLPPLPQCTGVQGGIQLIEPETETKVAKLSKVKE